MFPVIKVIHRILVRKFYERHAALLFFVFYVMFGMVESGQIVSYHLGLIYGALSSPLSMAIVYGMWLLYVAKAFLFFAESIGRGHNLFIRQISLLDKRSQFFLLAYASFLCYLPVFLYSMIIIAAAFKAEVLWAAFSIVAFHLAVISGCAWRSIHSMNTSQPPLLIIPSLGWPFSKPYPVFYIGLLADRLKIMFFLAKTFSILCLIGFLQIPLDHYEPRIAYLGMVVAITSYSVIIFEWRRFEDQFLQFTRVLPLGLTRRFFILVSAYSILLLPEFAILVAQKIYLLDALTAALLGVSFALFAHTSLYRVRLKSDRHLQRVLSLLLIIFFLALSKLAFPAAILLSVLSWWQFRKNFEGYEAAAHISA